MAFIFLCLQHVYGFTITALSPSLRNKLLCVVTNWRWLLYQCSSINLSWVICPTQTKPLSTLFLKGCAGDLPNSSGTKLQSHTRRHMRAIRSWAAVDKSDIHPFKTAVLAQKKHKSKLLYCLRFFFSFWIAPPKHFWLSALTALLPVFDGRISASCYICLEGYKNRGPQRAEKSPGGVMSEYSYCSWKLEQTKEIQGGRNVTQNLLTFLVKVKQVRYPQGNGNWHIKPNTKWYDMFCTVELWDQNVKVHQRWNTV